MKKTTEMLYLHSCIHFYCVGRSTSQVLYSQIVLKKGMPFDLCLSSFKSLSVDAMTREQLDAELQKGVDSIKAGKVYSADDVDAALEKEFGI